MTTRARRLQLIIAFGASSIGALVAPATAVGCSGDPLTFEAVIGGSELIVEGTVEEVLLDGLAYRLAVIEVFRGPTIDGEVRIGPATDPGGRGCEIGLAKGDHVILGVVDIDERLNALATGVWFVGPDGGLLANGALGSVATDVDELRDTLRRALPDSAVAAPRGALIRSLGWLMLGLSAVATLFRCRVIGRGPSHAIG